MRRRPAGILVLLLVTSLVALAGGWTLMFYAAWTIAFLLVVAYLLSVVGLRALYFERKTRALRAEVGSYFDERIIVENRSWIPKLWLEIEDQGQHPEHTVSFVVVARAVRALRAAGPHALSPARRLPAWAGLRRERRPVRAVPPAAPDRRRQHAGGLPGGVAAGRVRADRRRADGRRASGRAGPAHHHQRRPACATTSPATPSTVFTGDRPPGSAS